MKNPLLDQHSNELAVYDQTYEDLATKLSEHFLWIAPAINRTGDRA